jgi:hypothetical protein
MSVPPSPTRRGRRHLPNLHRREVKLNIDLVPVIDVAKMISTFRADGLRRRVTLHEPWQI